MSYTMTLNEAELILTPALEVPDRYVGVCPNTKAVVTLDVIEGAGSDDRPVWILEIVQEGWDDEDHNRVHVGTADFTPHAIPFWDR